MPTREELTAAIATSLQHAFPTADIAVKKDGLTASTVFTINDDGVARHLEVAQDWLDDGEAGVRLTEALRDWDVAQRIQSLEPNAVLRLGPAGLEKVT